MTTMIRKQIYLDPTQNEQLKRLAHQAGVPEAELIRQAIDTRLQSLHQLQPNSAVWEAERSFIEHLMAMESVKGVRTWTRDNLYDR